MTITDWPINERPREKLLTQGVLALSDAELLAIFLRTGVKGYTAVDLARQLLTQFGDLRMLLDSSAAQFCELHGLGMAKYVQLQAALEIGRRYLQTPLQRDGVIKNPTLTRHYILAKLRDHQQEVFACLFLDVKHRIISFDELFYGTINGGSVYPREVVKRALKHNAAAVILAHNHPSGVADPSTADKHVTELIQKALLMVDVKVLDHIIVGDGYTSSFVELGLLNP